MSRLNTFLQKKNALEKLAAEIAAMEESKELKDELAFVEEAKALLEKFNKTPADFAKAFQLDVTAPRVKSERKERLFKNPATGETLTAKSTNNKTLRQWAEQAGVDATELEVKE